MNPRAIITVSLFAATSLAHGAFTLDWADVDSWSNGSTTGSYNTLSGAAAVNSAINTLTYDFGGGLTATVSAVLTGGAGWQNGSAVYGGWAPRSDNDVFAFGIQNGSATTGATLVLTFNQAVTLDSIRIGDIDSGGSVQDRVSVLTDLGSLLSVSVPDTLAPTFDLSGNSATFTGITTNQGAFDPSATAAWAELTTGSTATTSLTISLLNGAGNHGIWLSDLTVSAAIPEPSAYALAFGFSTLVLVGARRRFLRRA